MKRLKLRDPFYLDADTFSLEVAGKHLELKDIQYLAEKNVLDNQCRSIMIFSEDKRDAAISCVLSICYFLQKKKSVNAKRYLRLPAQPVEVRYNGGLFRIESTSIANNGLTIINNNQNFTIDFDEIALMLSPWNSRDQANIDNLNTFKKYAELIRLERKGSIFSQEHFLDFKPEEGVILVTNRKTEFLRAIKNACVESLNQKYSFNDFFQVNGLEVKISRSQGIKYEYPLISNTPNHRNANSQLGINNYPNLLVVSYRDLPHLESVMGQFRNNYYKTILFDSFDDYYPKPDLYISRGADDGDYNIIAGERISKLEYIKFLHNLQSENKFKDIFYIADYVFPELHKDLIERYNLMLDPMSYNLYSWISDSCLKENILTSAEVDIVRPGKDDYNDLVDSLKSDVITECGNVFQYLNFDSVVKWKNAFSNLIYNARKRTKTCLSKELLVVIKNDSETVINMLKENFRNEEFPYINRFIDVINKIPPQDTKIEKLKEELLLKNNNDIVIVCENTNDHDLNHIMEVTGTSCIKNRRNIDLNDNRIHYFLDFWTRDLVKYYHLILAGQIKYVLYDDEILNLQKAHKWFTNQFKILSDFNMTIELFNSDDQDLNTVDQIVLSCPENVSIHKDEEKLTSNPKGYKTLNEIFLNFLEDKKHNSIEFQQFFKKERDENKRWLLLFDDGSIEAFSENSVLGIVEHSLYNDYDPELSDDYQDIEGDKTVEYRVCEKINIGDKVILIKGCTGDEYSKTLNIIVNDLEPDIYLKAYEWFFKLRKIHESVGSIRDLKQMLLEHNFNISATEIGLWLKQGITKPANFENLIRAINEIIIGSETLQAVITQIDIYTVLESVEKIRRIKSFLNRLVRIKSIGKDDVSTNYKNHSISEVINDSKIQLLAKKFDERINILTVSDKIDLM